MDIAALQAFVAVAENNSFSLAAEHIHLTQPAISKRVAGLENELGTRLFDRIGRRVMLTEAGRTLLPRALRILAEIADSRRALNNLSGLIGGVLRIGTSHHIGLHRLPDALRDYHRQHPDVELDLCFMDSERICQKVEHGTLELGVVTLPLQPAAVLRTTPLWDDPLAIVVGREHPLARQATISAAQLARSPAILPGQGTYTRTLIEAAFEHLGLELRAGPSTNFLETIRMMVGVGLGWSALPETLLNAELVTLHPPGVHIARTLGAVTHTERTLSNAALALLRVLRSAPIPARRE